MLVLAPSSKRFSIWFTIIPGTDALPGYSLHHELELYVRAGIPAPEVLRLATLTPSQVMGLTKDLGIIAAGKLADIVLIDGDPAKNIRETRNSAKERGSHGAFTLSPVAPSRHVVALAGTKALRAGRSAIRPRSKKPSA